MLFCSYIFILLFLPVTLTGYFLLGKRNVTAARLWLCVASLVFYGYFNWIYLFILLSSLVVNFGIGRLLWNRRSKAVLLVGILFNVLLIGYFKYYDFFIGNVNVIFKSSFALKHILLPLGISFYTFQQIAYLLDIYNGVLKERHSPLIYALFISFFPQLIAGPIVLATELMPQFEDRERYRVNCRNVACGIFVFALGLAKKILLADHFAVAADALFAGGAPGAADLLWGALSYMFQIYFDFSGYCDMAIGIGVMFNIDLPVNFRSPYRAADIREFWRTWHITLGRFLSQFVYFPLGGSRRGHFRTLVNLMLTFLISGIWHGAGWTFVLWGVIHGAAMVLHRLWSDVLHLRMPRWAGVMLTFVFVCAAWILFRAESIGDAVRIYAGAAKFSAPVSGVSWNDILYMAAAFFIIFALPPANSFVQKFRPCPASWITAMVLLVLSLFCMTRSTPFIYFNF